MHVLQNNEGSDKFSGLNRYSGRLILQIKGERKEVSFKNGRLIGWYLNFQGWQYVPSLSEKDRMCCNLRVRFSINQNNASACSVCSGSRLQFGHILINGGREGYVMATTAHPSRRGKISSGSSWQRLPGQI